MTDKPSQGTPDSITLNMDLQTAGAIGLFAFLKSKGFEVERAAQQPTASELPAHASDCNCPKCIYTLGGVSVGAPSEQEMSGARGFYEWWQNVGYHQMPNAGEPPEHAAIAFLAWRAALQSGDNRAGRIDFVEALKIVQCGFDIWKNKPHNAKWFKRIDGTPIPNDLLVNIAQEICNAL